MIVYALFSLLLFLQPPVQLDFNFALGIGIFLIEIEYKKEESEVKHPAPTRAHIAQSLINHFTIYKVNGMNVCGSRQRAAQRMAAETKKYLK